MLHHLHVRPRIAMSHKPIVPIHIHRNSNHNANNIYPDDNNNTQVYERYYSKTQSICNVVPISVKNPGAPRST